MSQYLQAKQILEWVIENARKAGLQTENISAFITQERRISDENTMCAFHAALQQSMAQPEVIFYAALPCAFFILQNGHEIEIPVPPTRPHPNGYLNDQLDDLLKEQAAYIAGGMALFEACAGTKPASPWAPQASMNKTRWKKKGGRHKKREHTQTQGGATQIAPTHLCLLCFEAKAKCDLCIHYGKCKVCISE